MKKWLSLMLALVLVMTLAPVCAFASEAEQQQEEVTVETDFVSLDPMFEQSNVVEVDEKEPNDGKKTANRIENHYIVSGTLGRGENKDVFKFVLKEPSLVATLFASQNRLLFYSITDGVKTLESGSTHQMRNGVYYTTVSVFLPAGTYYIELTTDCSITFGYAFQFETQAEAGSDNLVFRVFGATRYDTSFGIADQVLIEWKAQTGMEKFNSVVIASGTNFADALAGSYLAAKKQAPILLTSGKNVGSLSSYIVNNLEDGGTVYLLGGTAAVPEAFESALTGYVVKRLGGATRYETNLAILNEAGVSGQSILVCTGTGFADSLSASATGLPILLVKNSLTPAQKEMLTKGNGQIYIIGGTSAVSESVENALKQYGTVTRVGGSNRYETSVKVAQTFFGDKPFAAVLAYAQNFPDGLCGGPLAYSVKSPLILTATGKEGVAVSYATSQNIKNGYVLGGTSLISDNTARKIFNLPSSYVIVAQ